jgi:hypothetical protein
MRSSPFANSMSNLDPKPKPAVMSWRRLLAKTWVESAIAAKGDPFARQEPLSSGDAGEWKIVIHKAALNLSLAPEALRDDLWDEAFIVLAGLGRVKFADEPKTWHGNLLLDNCSPEAIALRTLVVRLALKMDHEQFYGACAINLKAAHALEAGHPAFASPTYEALDKLCDCHDIPESWLRFGGAMELET